MDGFDPWEFPLMTPNFDPSEIAGETAIASEPDYVRMCLRKVYHEFYGRVMSVPGMEPSRLPLVMRHMDGFIDLFSLEVSYSHYPMFFCDLFPEVDKEQLQALCVISQLYAESQVQLDNFIDDQLPALPEAMKTVILIGSQYKLAAATRRLSQLLDAKSFFWVRFDQLFGDYLCQIIEEKTADRSLEIPSVQDMERSAIGKVALVKIITAAMAGIAGREDLLPALEESQDLFAIGYQLYDDVKDWKKDFREGRFSYVLKKAFEEFSICDEIAQGRKPDPMDLGRRLYLSDIFPDILELAAGYMERSRRAVNGIDCPKWISWLEMQQNGISRLRRDLIEIRDRAIERSRLMSAPKRENSPDFFDLKSCDQALIKSIAFLQDQARKGYLEARHLEMVGRRWSLGGEPACYWGSVFQRAVTLHSLAQARQAGFCIDQEAFKADMKVLIDSRLKNRRGGWSYFPDWPHLPPDCDDLAEVLHVLIAVSHPKISELCEDPIDLALREQGRDGSISTWIADPSDDSSLRARDFMYETWGAEPDIDVMANFLFALWKYDRNRFGGNILAGTSYIARRQDSDGSWASTWYDGPYYGTWICCRHLDAMGGFDVNLNRARGFLLRTQMDDGGWDVDGILNTSYALLALADPLGERNPGVIMPAARRILSLQRDDGSWRESPFIKMRTRERDSLPEKGSSPSFYGSCTMSTAFAIRALLAIRKLIS